MKYEIYQEKASRTCPDLGSEALNLSHMVLGMCSEVSELREAMFNMDSVNIGEELADINWYIANYERLRGRIVEGNYSFKEFNPTIDILYNEISELQDLVKKFIAYGKEIDIINETSLLGSIKNLLKCFYIQYNLNEEEYLAKNIAKLESRYPEKFTNEKALNRDLETERRILES